MSWLRIDDGFVAHGKVAPLSDAALRLWMLAACWCQKHPHTNGFVPTAMLPVIGQNRWPVRQLQKLATELVEARIAGTKEHGLWEPIDGGWLFHDWEDYQLTPGPQSGPGGGTPPSETPRAKSEAGRLGGLKSAESRRSKNGTAQPKQTPKQPEANLEAPSKQTAEATPKQNPEAARSRIEADPQAPPQAAYEAPVPVPVPVTAEVDPRPPTSGPEAGRQPSQRDTARQSLRTLEAATQIPLKDRAKLVVDNPDLAGWSQPQQWPEVVSAANALAAALGQPEPRLGDIGRDRGVLAVVGLFADGFTSEELTRACQAATDDPWFKRERRGLASLTPEVVRRLLSPAQGANADPTTGAHQLSSDVAEAARTRLAAEREEARRQNRERLQREQQEQSA